MLQPGDTAPDFEAMTDEDKPLKLSDLRGQNVILYFYPRADTPGCTKEACSFRDNFPRFSTENAVVLGVSTDTVKAQSKFKQKYQLPFTLLADTDKDIHEKYGTWVEKSMYGKKYMGTARSTFIIGPDGKIRKVFENVKPEQHAEQVLTALAE
ncbi:MAG: thioredoxin-dependent thiol peroxidase [Anaerolineae bacterium]|nr:thioredoxin-dependent thiol peroxidase [Anaerolineae bacterium]